MRRARPACWPLVVAALGFCPLETARPSSGPAVLQAHGPARLKAAAPLQKGALAIALSDLLDLWLTVEGSATLQVEPGGVAASEAWRPEAGKPGITRLKGGRVRWAQRVRLEPLAPGKHEVRLEPLHYREGEGEWSVVTWKPVPVHVTSRVKDADVGALRDITAIEELPPRPSRAAWWAGALGCLGVGALAGAGYWLWRRHAGARTFLSPAQWAERELDRLAALKLPERGAVERYHTLLSNVVRGYLEKRFHLPARRQTTPEFLAAVARSPELAPPQRAFLDDFLRRCDLAKFAGVAPSPEACMALAKAARRFVHETAETARAER